MICEENEPELYTQVSLVFLTTWGPNFFILQEFECGASVLTVNDSVASVQGMLECLKSL